MVMKLGEYTFRVATHECGKSGTATLPTICNYLQEAACLNAKELGFNKSDFEAAGEDITWVLTKLKVVVKRYPCWAENLTVRTFPRGGRKIVAWRDFEILDSDGRRIVAASSEWMIINMTTRKIVPVPQSVLDLADTGIAPVLGTEPFSRLKWVGRVAPSTAAAGTECRPYRTLQPRHSDIDINGHVNNVHYLEWMLEEYPERRPLELEMVFKSETMLGTDVLVESAPTDDGGICHRVFDAEGHDHVIAVTRLVPPEITYNSDTKIRDMVLRGLQKKEGYCPCRLPKTPEFFCPCEEFRGQMADPNYHGFCHCRLYQKT